MASPILLKAWFSNEITGLPFTNLFVHYRKSKNKTLKLTKAIDQLVENGILQKGIKDTRHIVTARKETYLKTSPVTIRHNADMLNYLQSIGINIDNYEHVYLSSPLPMNMELMTVTVDLILSNEDYLQFCHLFNDARIERQMEERLSKQSIQYRTSFGRKQYYMPLSSQMVGQDHVNIPNSQAHSTTETVDDDATTTTTTTTTNNNNNNLSSTFIMSSHRSITNLSPAIISSDFQNSSLFSEIHNLMINGQSSHNNFVDQTVTEAEPSNHFQHDQLSFIDDTLNQLRNMIDPCLSSTDESTLTSNIIETISQEPVSRPLNLYKKKNYEQKQIQSELENIELSSNDNNNFLQTETTSHNMSTFLEDVNSQQTLELISELVQNKKNLLKRVLEQQDNDFTSKRLRNNEQEEITLPNFDLNLNLSESFSSTPIQMESNSSTGDKQINEQDYHNSISNQNHTNLTPNNPINDTLFSNITTSTMIIDDIVSTAPSVDTLFDGMFNKNNSYISNNDTNLNNASTLASVNSAIINTSNIFTIMESNDQQMNIISDCNESTSNDNQDENTVDEQDLNDINLVAVYEKLILSNTIVMSKSDICVKLKHVIKVSKLRDKIISTLVDDKLLIEGNWFAVKRANGNISFMPGYLKAFPKDDIQDQQDFVRSLTKYGIHYHDFEQSLKKKKTDLYPRTLTASDIKYNNKWLFSMELADIIEKNSFLHERIILDPSVVIRETNASAMLNKRHRKPQQRYSPSDNK